MTNLLVSTSNTDEKARLEEEFSEWENYFQVPEKESSTLEAIFRAVSFQSFHNTPPLLAQKILTFAENAVSRIFCLDLLREMMQIVSAQQHKVALYRQYFSEINRELCDDQDEGRITSREIDNCPNQQNDQVFALAQMGQMRLTRHLQSAEFQQISDLKRKNYSPYENSQRTQLPSFRCVNPEDEPYSNSNPVDNLSQIFCSADNYYGNNEWWKQENHPNDSSKEISKFDCKAGTPLHQKSIGMLVMQELRYDLNRQIEIGRDMNKHQEMEGIKYKKMMKEKLLTAKLKKRRKK